MTIDPDWWRTAVVYQIYPRSFADSNADGVGDIPGIISRVPYLASLGIDAVWLSPFYPSALADGGYDVDDPRAVDPRLGTLEDVDRLIAALDAHGIRLIVDVVPNHTSDRHRWFVEALAAAPGSVARDRYHFRDGLGPDGDQPPADWVSGFGELMWTPTPGGQWYLHIHAAEQPDLNWAHPEVRADYLETLRFWADRGVAGFRIDVAHLLAKDLPAQLPSQVEMDALPPGRHPLVDRDEVQEIYAEWRAVFDSYDPPRTAVAEAWVTNDRRPRYSHAGSLGQAFNFDLLQANWNADEFRQVIETNLELADRAGSSSTWVLSNHDVVRHATRYGLPQGDPERPQNGRDWLLSRGATPPLDDLLGLDRARAATLLILGLPGSTYLYQGEEMGLHEVADLPDAARQDPTFRRTAGAEPGRDGCRVPLPWERDAPAFGFSSGEPHLPQPSWFAESAVDTQEGSESSTLELYRRALRLRKRLPQSARLEWVDVPTPGALHFRRGAWHFVTAFDEPLDLPPGLLRLSSQPVPSYRQLAPNTTAWLQEL